MTAEIVYTGSLRTTATHLQSGSIIETDAPTDNNGQGARFSPTDLLCTSLAACIVTTMAIKAAQLHIDIEGTRISVTKFMKPMPRKIDKIEITLHFPNTLAIDEKNKTILERTAHACPVALSLHPDVTQAIHFVW